MNADLASPNAGLGLVVDRLRGQASDRKSDVFQVFFGLLELILTVASLPSNSRFRWFAHLAIGILMSSTSLGETSLRPAESQVGPSVLFARESLASSAASGCLRQIADLWPGRGSSTRILSERWNCQLVLISLVLSLGTLEIIAQTRKL